MANNYKTIVDHLMSMWHKQTDKDDLAFNPVYVQHLARLAEGSDAANAALNPAYLEAEYDVQFSGQTYEPRPAIFIELE